MTRRDTMLTLLRVIFYVLAVVGLITAAIGLFADTSDPDVPLITVGVGGALAFAFFGAISGAIDDIRAALLRREQP